MASTEADIRRVVRIKVGLLRGDLDLAGVEGVGVGGDMDEIIWEKKLLLFVVKPSQTLERSICEQM